MAKVLVLYYSAYGHIEAMANAVAEGAREAGAQVDIKRVSESVPEEIARKSYYKLDQAAPIAKVEDLAPPAPCGNAESEQHPQRAERAERVHHCGLRSRTNTWSSGQRSRRCVGSRVR